MSASSGPRALPTSTATTVRLRRPPTWRPVGSGAYRLQKRGYRRAGSDAPEHDDVGAVSDFTEGGRGTTAFLRREQRGYRRRRSDAVDSGPERVGDRDSGALRFARDVRGQKDQGPRGSAQHVCRSGQRFVERSVPAANEDSRRRSTITKPARAEWTGVARIDNPVAPRRAAECRRTHSRTPDTSRACLLVVLPQEIKDLRGVGEIRLEMRAAGHRGVDGVHACGFRRRRHLL